MGLNKNCIYEKIYWYDFLKVYVETNAATEVVTAASCQWHTFEQKE